MERNNGADREFGFYESRIEKKKAEKEEEKNLIPRELIRAKHLSLERNKFIVKTEIFTRNYTISVRYRGLITFRGSVKIPLGSNLFPPQNPQFLDRKRKLIAAAGFRVLARSTPILPVQPCTDSLLRTRPVRSVNAQYSPEPDP